MKFSHFIFFSFVFIMLSRSLEAGDILFKRSDKGTLISENERQLATDQFIALIKGTKYFDYVDSRVHGSPESDPSTPFWWASFWTGVKASKKDGLVTYTHAKNGSDNVGIHTSPYLEGSCYAYLLTGNPKYSHLSRKLMRGLSAWILSSAKSPDDIPAILSRTFYRSSTHSSDGGRNLYLNYEAARPGIKSDASEYVHIPNNPSFGDIWLKNKRSIDDIGHMLRAIAQVQSCSDVFDGEAKEDLKQLNQLYMAWAKNVDANHFIIPTYNPKGDVILEKKGIGDYNAYKLLAFDPACVEKLAVRLVHSSDPQDLKCGKGISSLEKLAAKYLQNDAIEILRTHHIAATALARLKGRPDLAVTLMSGLSERMDRDLLVARNLKLSPKFDVQDIPTFFVHAHNVGVPLTSNEIRLIYERLQIAHSEMLAPKNFNTFHLFDPIVPDGEYSFDPPNNGLYFYTLGAMIGTCTSSLRHSGDRQLFDCDRLKKALLQ